MERETYNALVETIYDASIDSERWRDVVVDIGKVFSSPVTGLFIQTKDQEYGGGIFEGFDEGILSEYEREYAVINPWFNTPNLMRPGHIISDRTLEQINNDEKQFVNSDFYQSFYKPLELRHSMGVNLIDSQSNHLNFTFIRTATDGYYKSSEIEVFQSLSRHLMKAVELNSYVDSLESRQTTNEDILDALRVGIFVVGYSGRVEHMNSYARNLIYEDSSLFVQHSRLKARGSHSNQLLSRAIKDGYTKHKSTSIAIRRHSKPSLTATIIPSTSKRSLFGLGQTSLMVFITDPDDRDIGDVEYLVQRWSLTPVEAEFACYLLKGLKISQVAERMELTQNTAQWYSKQLLRKLDVPKQSELIIKLMNDMALIKRP